MLVCRHFTELARSFGAEQILAVATSATREARNRRVLLDRLKEEAGLDASVVSGKEEARLIYLGVSSGIHLEEKQAIYIDIGGGSTEIAVGTRKEFSLVVSRQFRPSLNTTLTFGLSRARWLYSAKVLATPRTFGSISASSWISQTITPISAYNYYYATADECCAFVCDNKASIYYFDIKANQWTEHQIPNGEKPNLLAASDDVFIAVGDSSIIGSSSILQQISFRRFEGNPFNFYYNGQFQPYACYGKLAAFLTEENLYVFDAEIGSWQVRNYSLPPNFLQYGQLYIKDDYLLVIFNNSINARPINIVYKSPSA